jgi:predicted secreted protein
MPSLELSEIDSGKLFDIDNGSLILIKLKENPSTRYKWVVHSFDDKIIQFKGLNNSTESGNRLGESGVTTFTFEAQSLGTTIIQLQLERNWDKSNPINQFKVSLHVK